jgi:hypothetical protein
LSCIDDEHYRRPSITLGTAAKAKVRRVVSRLDLCIRLTETRRAVAFFGHIFRTFQPFWWSRSPLLFCSKVLNEMPGGGRMSDNADYGSQR